MPLLPDIIVTFLSSPVVSTANGQFLNCATTAFSERYDEHLTVTEILITIDCKSCNTSLLSERTFSIVYKTRHIIQAQVLKLLLSALGEQ
jgi:hypothetical protein